MPTVIRRNGFEVRIYTADHMPAHVHIVRGAGRMVIDIETLATRRITGMTSREIRQALELVEENREFLRVEWKRISPIA